MKNLITLILGISLVCSCNSNDLNNDEELLVKNELINQSVEKNNISIYLNNWMSNITDSKNITQISIPGTHDSGALHDPVIGPSYTAKTQNLTIKEQLNIGIRFLDIRCKVSDNGFAIYHGPINQNLKFENVVKSIKEFLQNNPSEFILLSIKKEDLKKDNNNQFAKVFEEYLTGELGSIVYKDNKIFPSIKEVRGKVIIIKRFSNTSKVGYNANSGWVDNYKGDFTIYNNLSSFTIQDYYNVDNLSNKWEIVENQFLNASSSYSTSAMYLNFTSGIKKNILYIPNIKTVSDYINPKVKDYFNSSTKKNNGVCIMDFANANYTFPIINSNFK
ncbi:phosphatidylinositol-specific phospholipase C [Chryseobacterium fistulae]|uniref:1-phosphatidylinositol phosphodiesterase n=1 Tax=Chryseobacterium fistulae TaxID=2675058 RepID=A0A6N4XVY6_9FLAO|nr:phosphatidylinositol-specific phospholipase C [Chryseobacterium fistulae]CAA7392518.1 1-phosphatidylinositol phosphodiesterase [Chryseobacterium fistulae]